MPVPTWQVLVIASDPKQNMSVPLLVRLEILIATVRWRLARPGHQCVYGRK